MADERRLELEVRDGVATLTFARPEAHNAIDLPFVQALDRETERIDRLVADGEVGCLVVRAQGRNFCVGGDLGGFTTSSDTAAHIAFMAGHAHRGIDRLHHLPVPVVTAAQGAVAGAGLGFLLASDVVVVTDSATFTVAYAAAGITPDAGVSWGLPRAVGRIRAMDALLSNRRVSASEAAEWGLVSRVVPADRLDDEVAGLVRSITALPTELVRENKRLMRQSLSVPLTEHLADEAESIARFSAAPFAQQAIAAFLRAREAPRPAG